MPTRSVAPNDQIVATLTFDGVGDTGASVGDTRNVTGFSVTNNTAAPVHVKVEEEADKARTVEATVQPGQTLADGNIPPGQRPRQVWRVIGSISMWDGLNVYWS